MNKYGLSPLHPAMVELKTQSTRIDELEKALGRPLVVERGPWSASSTGGGIASDDFTHDVILRVTGDFADETQRKAYADELVNRLNRQLPPDDGEFIRLKAEVTRLNACLHKKNIALDALHWVWCSGGCRGGLHRYAPGDLTEELVAEAERNTKRLRAWWENAEFKTRWPGMTDAERMAWMNEHTQQKKEG